MKPRRKAIWHWKIVGNAIKDALLKLNPRTMMGNPVMFVVEIGSVITTALLFRGGSAFKFNLQITLWLWFTVLFANFAEAMAEGRGKAQAATLRAMRRARTELAETLRSIEPKPEEAEKLGDPYPLMVLRAGIEFNEWFAKWCERMEAQLLEPARVKGR